MTRLRIALVIALAIAASACGGRARSGGHARVLKSPTTLAERMLALLPEGAQVLVELDLARLKANPAVGDVVTRGLDLLGADTRLPGLPIAVQGSPLAHADLVVLAAYGVGTVQAASVTLLATKAEVPGAVRLSPDLVVLGPEDWTSQVEARAAIAEHAPIAPSLGLMELRDHAMPAKAPGAVLRVTAQLPFDARVALARQIGMEAAPAQLSIWADVVDDFALIIDADAADPGEKQAKNAAARLEKSLSAVLAAVQQEPAVQALGLTSAVRDARTITERTWVRTIITVGPRQLTRAVERARAMLPPAS